MAILGRQMDLKALIDVLSYQFGIESLFGLWYQERQIDECFQYLLVKRILRID